MGSPTGCRARCSGLSAGEAAVVPQRPRDHLRAIISPEILWGTSLGDELLDDGDDVLGGAGPVDPDRECLAGVLIDDVAELDAAAVGRLIELEVHGPHLVRLGRSQTRCLPVAHPAALAGPHRPSEALLAPDSPGALAIDRPAFPQQDLVCCLPTPPWVLFSDLPQPARQTLIRVARW